MKQTRSLSEFSCLYEYTRLNPIALPHKDENLALSNAFLSKVPLLMKLGFVYICSFNYEAPFFDTFKF